MFGLKKRLKETAASKSLSNILSQKAALQDEIKIKDFYKKTLFKEYLSLGAIFSYLGILIAMYMTFKLGYFIGEVNGSGMIMGLAYGIIPVTILAGIYFMFYNDPTKIDKFDVKTYFVRAIGIVFTCAVVAFNFISIQHEVGNTYADNDESSIAANTRKDAAKLSSSETKSRYKVLSALNLEKPEIYTTQASSLLLKNKKIYRRTRKCTNISSRLKRRTQSKYQKFCDKYSKLKELTIKATEKEELRGILNATTTEVIVASKIKTTDGGKSDAMLAKILHLEESTIKENKPTLVSAAVEFILELFAVIMGMLHAGSAKFKTRIFAQDLILNRQEKAIVIKKEKKVAKKEIALKLKEGEANVLAAKSTLVQAETENLNAGNMAKSATIADLANVIDFTELPATVLVHKFVEEMCILDINVGMTNTSFVDSFNNWININKGIASQEIDYNKLSETLKYINCTVSNEGHIKGVQLR